MLPSLYSILEPFRLLLSGATTLARIWAGWPGRAAARMPEQTLILYEFEGCPFCRIARESITSLRLPVEIRPCPKRGRRFRPRVLEMGGKAQFPYLVDPNTGIRMYESADIVRYLHRTYGERRAPISLYFGPLNVQLSALGLALRGSNGLRSRHRTAEIDQPLLVSGAEADPRARLLRELLCELELPYVLTPGRAIGLRDPNTSTTLDGSFSARQYLLAQYG
jgi:glutaredoxin